MKKAVIITIGAVLAFISLFFILGGQIRNSRDSHKLQIDTPDPGYLAYPVRILDRAATEALTFDPGKGKPATISYKLTRDGHIRIRVVRRDQKDLVLRTLLDWTHQEFGKHEVKWDGRDASGNILNNKQCFILFEGDSVKHKEHDREKCREPKLEIIYPDEPGAAVEKLSEIKAKVADEDGYWKEYGYTLRVYVDYALLYRTSTMNIAEFHLRDLPVEDGEHIVTVNLDDGHDHVGTASAEVNVQR